MTLEYNVLTMAQSKIHSVTKFVKKIYVYIYNVNFVFVNLCSLENRFCIANTNCRCIKKVI